MRLRQLKPSRSATAPTKAPEFSPVQVEITEPKTVAWCQCKHTKTPPFCDGSHKQI